MMALVKKDFFVLARQMKMFWILLAVFAVLPQLSMSIFAIVYCGMMPYTAMAYDERSKWNDLAVMMPYTSEDIVLSKYVLGWVAIALSTILSVTAHYLLQPIFPDESGSALFTILPSCCIGVIMMALTLPLMFRLGVERGRMFFVILMAVFACGGAGLVSFVSESSVALPSAFSTLLILGIPVLAVILTAISIPLSIAFYNHKKAA